MPRGVGVEVPSERFNPLVLDEHSVFLESVPVYLLPHHADDPGASLTHKVTGTLRVCSDCVVFDAEDTRVPVYKLRWEHVSVVEKWTVPRKWKPLALGKVFRVVARTHWTFKENGRIAPHRRVDRETAFALLLRDRPLDNVLGTLTALQHAWQPQQPRDARAALVDEIVRRFTDRVQVGRAHLVDGAAEQILLVRSNVVRVLPYLTQRGFVALSSHRIYFIPVTNAFVNCGDVSVALGAVTRIVSRRHMLRNTAVEIFMLGFESLLFAFGSTADRDSFVTAVRSQPRLTRAAHEPPLDAYTERWVRGDMSNFDYLMLLNSYAGRTFNDLRQYPVFPWVLADYESDQLDLTSPASFRDLSRPVGALNPARLAGFLKRYRDMVADYSRRRPGAGDDDDDDDDDDDAADGFMRPFMYGTHYSCPAYVIFYLLRAAPEYALHLQGGRFDHADRLFKSVPEAWKSCLTNDADVRELIPEFYMDPGDFLMNSLDLDLGVAASGVPVNDVVLPPWARSPSDFTARMREALESEYVSANLHHWIDLVFGFKQRGPEADAACNVFAYYTYDGAVDLDAIDSEDERRALEVQINEFGQCPAQLFAAPHPQRKTKLREFTEHIHDLRQAIVAMSSSVVLDHAQIGAHAPGAPTVQAVASGVGFVAIPPLHGAHHGSAVVTGTGSGTGVSAGSESATVSSSTTTPRQQRSGSPAPAPAPAHGGGGGGGGGAHMRTQSGTSSSSASRGNSAAPLLPASPAGLVSSPSPPQAAGGAHARVGSSGVAGGGSGSGRVMGSSDVDGSSPGSRVRRIHNSDAIDAVPGVVDSFTLGQPDSLPPGLPPGVLQASLNVVAHPDSSERPLTVAPPVENRHHRTGSGHSGHSASMLQSAPPSAYTWGAAAMAGGAGAGQMRASVARGAVQSSTLFASSVSQVMPVAMSPGDAGGGGQLPPSSPMAAATTIPSTSTVLMELASLREDLQRLAMAQWAGRGDEHGAGLSTHSSSNDLGVSTPPATTDAGASAPAVVSHLRLPSSGSGGGGGGGGGSGDMRAVASAVQSTGSLSARETRDASVQTDAVAVAPTTSSSASDASASASSGQMGASPHAGASGHARHPSVTFDESAGGATHGRRESAHSDGSVGADTLDEVHVYAPRTHPPPLAVALPTSAPVPTAPPPPGAGSVPQTPSHPLNMPPAASGTHRPVRGSLSHRGPLPLGAVASTVGAAPAAAAAAQQGAAVPPAQGSAQAPSTTRHTRRASADFVRMQMDAKEQALTTMQAEIDRLQSRLAQSSVRQLESKAQALERQVPTLVKQIDTLNERLARARNDNDALLEEVKDMRALLRETERSFDARLRRQQAKQQDELRMEREQHLRERADLTRRLRDATAEVETLRAAYRAAGAGAGAVL